MPELGSVDAVRVSITCRFSVEPTTLAPAFDRAIRLKPFEPVRYALSHLDHEGEGETRTRVLGDSLERVRTELVSRGISSDWLRANNGVLQVYISLQPTIHDAETVLSPNMLAGWGSLGAELRVDSL